MASEIENNGAISSANLLTTNVQMTGQSSSSSDYDFFKLYASGQGTAQFSLILPSNNYSSYYVNIYDSSGALQKSYTTSSSATYSVVSQSSGYSYISVNSFSTADYAITGSFLANSNVNAKNEVESNGSMGTANLLTTNVQMTGQSSSSSDYDFFKLYASGQGTAQFSLILPSNNYSSYYVNIYDSSGALQKSYTTSSSATYSVVSQSSGYSYISVNSFSTADYAITGSFLANSTQRNPTYSIISTASSVNEGGTATFTLATTNLTSGTVVPYTLSGISTQDVSGGSLSGNAIINSSGLASISVTLLNDSLTEGSETLTVTSSGSSASIQINDTSKAAAIPSYSLAASTTSVNEGSTATFTLTTTNVVSGTSVPYTISGISASDISGFSLSGSTTVASNGQATISVFIVNDILTEGTETLTVTAGGASASTQINDTSKPAAPTYTLRTNWTSTTEGTPIIATLSTTNVTFGTTLYYQLSGSGINNTDFGGLPLTGSSVINSLGQTTLNIPISADTTTEGDETFVIQYFTDSGRSITAGSAAYVTILDTSKGAVTPAYAVSANSSSVNEGSTAGFTITTSNVSAGSSIAYTLSGVSSSDITGGGLTGYATVNSAGTATVSVPISSDSLTEGSETLTISLQGKTASILINDTSKASSIPTYALSSSGISANEGSVAIFNLTTIGVSPGSSIPYTISGVSSSDVTGDLSGTATVDINGLATISVPIAADFLTEGTETLTVTAQGKSASVIVNDTSKTTLIASYALSASTNSVSEGSNAVFTLTTTNVAGGTFIPYTISGVSSADITGGALSGTAIVSSSGNATITIPIALDLTTEGIESLTVTAQGISTSVLISDTSTMPVVVTPTTTVTSIPYGNGKYFYASAGSDKVTGTSFFDVVKQTSTISSNQLTKLSDGSWQVQNKISPLNSDNLVNVERIEFNDMSVALDVSGPAGQVAKILGAVFGPSYVNNTEYAGIGLAYLDDGMSYQDLCSGAAGAAGLSTPELLVTALLRNATGFEPTALSKAEYLQSISNGASYGSVVQQIADSSVNAQSIKLTDIANTGLAYKPHFLPATYSLSSTSSLVNEGSNAVFNLKTSNVNVGTELSYTLSGINFSDTAAGSLTGKVIVGTGGLATISIPISADGATEGQETLTIDVQGATASVLINDTSKGSAIPTYTLTPVSLSVNEGELAQVYVNTKNVTAGTILKFDISGVGITQGDVFEGLSRFVTVTPSWELIGRGLININTVADQLTEGPETMFITLGGSTTSIIINDTSVTLVGVVDNSGGGDGGSGGGGGAGGD